ncbi:MAG TPA: bifunctional glutamate N-acetyltransferase/amino-acid acetyltransferase ArgJ [Clostridia bacterium]|nr:bifunctional glutamate N-acetyltransferase/amino-acid acetyltransferase ArgJ [Clostridia bacterium]
MKEISGGVCAPKGFKASGIHCGIRKNKMKRDLALIVSDNPCSAASVYTTNLVQGAPIKVTKKNLSDGKAQAIICNSGNANTCNANGEEIAEQMCALVEKHTAITKNDIIIASTGVIGQPLDIAPIEKGMSALVLALGNNSADANEAIMTTDTIHKEIAIEFEIGGAVCKIGGIAKGSGMIHPNMATMLVFLTTDVAITPKLLQQALNDDIKTTFNMVSVDGDTSTNDMLSILANGNARNPEIIVRGESFSEFTKALNYVTTTLCKMIAKDGEGATKLIECNVNGANDEGSAQAVAKSVICSSLVKAAMFGEDANWGRILCAIGYSKSNVDINKIDVEFESKEGSIKVCQNGAGVLFCEDTAKKILTCDEIKILVNLNSGDMTATAWGCDLTYDYVRINGDYRT